MKSGTENRRTSRFNVPLEHEMAALRSDAGMIPARLVDQSAGGFAVWVEPPCDVQEGTVTQLRWVGGWSHVRVNNRVDYENEIRFGLERLEDITSESEIDPRATIWSARRPRLPMPSAGAAAWVYGSLVVFGILLAAGVWLLMPYATGNNILQAPSGRGRPSADWVAHLKLGAKRAVVDAADTSPAVKQKKRKTPPRSTGELTQAAEDWVSERLGAIGKTAKNVIGAVLRIPVDFGSPAAAVGQAVDSLERAMRFDDSVVLVLPRFVDYLQITDQQRQYIEAVIQSTRDATQEIHRQARQLGTAAAMQEIDRIRRDGSAKVMAALTPQQVEELKALVMGRKAVPSTAGSTPAP